MALPVVGDASLALVSVNVTSGGIVPPPGPYLASSAGGRTVDAVPGDYDELKPPSPP